MIEPMPEQKRPVKPWVVLIVAPWIILFVTILLQMGVNFLFRDANGLKAILNILSLLAGSLAVFMLLGLPVWVVMLVVAIDRNKKLQTPPAQAPTQPTPEPPVSPAPPTSQQPPAPPVQ